MTLITMNGSPTHTKGSLPPIGSAAPDFTVTTTELGELSLRNYEGKKVLLNIFPSLDTTVCAKIIAKFNEIAQKFPNMIFLCLSADLPFAQKRFCSAEHLQNVICVSVFRHFNFGNDYGVTIIDGPLAGLLSRAVVVIDEHGKVIYAEQVKEISDEPHYERIINVLS